MVDKNKPFTWRPYKKSLCKECLATCCTMPLEVQIEDLVGLRVVDAGDVGEGTKKDLQRVSKLLKKRGIIKSYRDSTGLFLMESKPNGDCQFLDSNRLCSVYDRRPGVCRKFPESMGLRLGFCPFLKK
ncbi:MAG: hypothetical protein RJB66_940 [Pseudomonadota bacterium]|jgi:Fe-S-cluster containining protein